MTAGAHQVTRISLAGFGWVATLSLIHKRRGSGARSLESTEGLVCLAGHASLKRTPVWKQSEEIADGAFPIRREHRFGPAPRCALLRRIDFALRLTWINAITHASS